MSCEDYCPVIISFCNPRDFWAGLLLENIKEIGIYLIENAGGIRWSRNADTEGHLFKKPDEFIVIDFEIGSDNSI